MRRENCLRIQVEKKFVARTSRIPLLPGPLPFLEIKCKFLYYSWQFRLMSRRPSNYFPTSYVVETWPKRTSLLFVRVLEIFFNPFQRGEQVSFEEQGKQWSILFNFLFPEEERSFLLAYTFYLTLSLKTRRGKALFETIFLNFFLASFDLRFICTKSRRNYFWVIIFVPLQVCLCKIALNNYVSCYHW